MVLTYYREDMRTPSNHLHVSHWSMQCRKVAGWTNTVLLFHASLPMPFHHQNFLACHKFGNTGKLKLDFTAGLNCHDLSKIVRAISTDERSVTLEVVRTDRATLEWSNLMSHHTNTFIMTTSKSGEKWANTRICRMTI